MSSISASAPCSATQGENRSAQRRRASRNAAVPGASSGRVTRSGQIARPSPSDMPRRSPAASASAVRLARMSPDARSATTPSGCPACCGSARSTRSAARRGNQSERMRRWGIGGGDSNVPDMFPFYVDGRASRVACVTTCDTRRTPSDPVQNGKPLSSHFPAGFQPRKTPAFQHLAPHSPRRPLFRLATPVRASIRDRENP